MHYHTLRFILWDHLSHDISSLKGIDPKSDLVVFLETMEEAESVNHHVKKLAFLFSSMRHFAKEIKEKGFPVLYIDIEQEEGSLTSGMEKILKQTKAKKLVVTEPGEYRVLTLIKDWEQKFEIEIEIRPDERFFISTEEFKEWSLGKKKLLMESFYQFLRKQTGYLLKDDGTPEGGQWNFDHENRNPIKGDIDPPLPFHVEPDTLTKEVLGQVKKRFSKHFGDLLPFWFAVTQDDAKKALHHFVHKALPHFGTYQDAMRDDQNFLYHSLLSHYLNVGLLHPKQVCDAAEKAYLEKKVPIQSAEGFIRQILGWREYVRGIYWLKMPDFAKENFLEAKRKLPWFYWSGETEMNCLKQVIRQTKEQAYSHHIQRLMVTGNFALLIGTLPEEICSWYLAVYADAHDWVELPNTLGMSQFAEGGFLGTKPYVSSGSYIHKMSNFCQDCPYDVKLKEGEKACPFNYLYWDFLLRNQDKLEKNPRLSMPYQMLKKFSKEKKKQIQEDAKHFLNKLEKQ